MLAIIPEFLFAALTHAYGVTGASEGFRTETEKTLALLLMSTMTFLFIKCINQVTRKRDYLTIENKTFTVLLMLPTATIVMLGCMFYSHTSFEGMNRVMVPVGASLLLMTNIFIFTVFDLSLIHISVLAVKVNMRVKKCYRHMTVCLAWNRRCGNG